MKKKHEIDKDFRELKDVLKSTPDLYHLIKSIESSSKEVKLNKGNQKLDLPYVSAEPIRRPQWNQ